MSRSCFVIMPFIDALDGIWNTVIRPVVEAAGDRCFRADDIFTPGPIMSDILRSIITADYLIAELTYRNPNVYYELGIAHALTKPVILLTQDIDALPFDLRHQRVILYTDTALGAAKLHDAIARVLVDL